MLRFLLPLFLLLTVPAISTRAQDAVLSSRDELTVTKALAPSATFTVTKTADTNDGVCDSDCSLREAIAAAASGDTIVFASPLFDTAQTITLGATLGLSKSLTITGRSANLTRLSGANVSRVLAINNVANVTISGLTIKDGIAGGGGGILIVNGVMNVLNSTVSGNSAGSGGGGISNSGTLNLTNSTVSGNTAGNNGGGILNDGTINVTNSTVSGNFAANNSTGGGIFNFSGTFNLINSTVSGNSAGSGGGIYNIATFNARNAIIAGNSLTGTFGPDFRGPLVSLGNNLIGNTGATNMTGDTTGNIINQDARLAPLGFYGGETMTHALLSSSPAINAGNNCVTTANGCGNNNPAVPTDSRGAGRIGAVDIGAFEVNSSANGGSYRGALPDGNLSVPYSFMLVPANGVTTYALSGGALPPGMNLTTALAPNAVVSLTGTPTSGGAFNFSVTATNGANTSVTDYSINIVVPTAAGVSVSGRVMTNDGRGLRNATVTMTDASGVTRTARSSSFGYFRFDDVEAGQTYVVSVNSKRFTFAPQVVFVGDEVVNLEFVGQ